MTGVLEWRRGRGKGKIRKEGTVCLWRVYKGEHSSLREETRRVCSGWLVLIILYGCVAWSSCGIPNSGTHGGL